MSDQLKSKSRRSVLKGLAVASAVALPGLSFAAPPATAAVNTTKLAVTDTEVIVGQLHSATGTMAISETGAIQAERLAIDQINAMGGILGRKIKVIQEDLVVLNHLLKDKASRLLDLIGHLDTVLDSSCTESFACLLTLLASDGDADDVFILKFFAQDVGYLLTCVV